MVSTEKCAGSGQRWEAGTWRSRANGRRYQGRAHCPVCGQTWAQLGRYSSPQVDNPHHTVPVH